MDTDGKSPDHQQAPGAFDQVSWAGHYRSPYTPLPAPQNPNQRPDLELDAAISLLQPIYEFVGQTSPRSFNPIPPSVGYTDSSVDRILPTTVNPAQPVIVYRDPNVNSGYANPVLPAPEYPDPDPNDGYPNVVPPLTGYPDPTANNGYSSPYHPQDSQRMVGSQGTLQKPRHSTSSISPGIRPPDKTESASPQASGKSWHFATSSSTPKKTRAKTGCLTCRKRKTKVRHLPLQTITLLVSNR